MPLLPKLYLLSLDLTIWALEIQSHFNRKLGKAAPERPNSYKNIWALQDQPEMDVRIEYPFQIPFSMNCFLNELFWQLLCEWEHRKGCVAPGGGAMRLLSEWSSATGLSRPGQEMGLRIKPNPFQFKAQSKLLCRKRNAGNACFCGEKTQTECGTEDNFLHVVPCEKRKGRQ